MIEVESNRVREKNRQRKITLEFSRPLHFIGSRFFLPFFFRRHANDANDDEKEKMEIQRLRGHRPFRATRRFFSLASPLTSGKNQIGRRERKNAKKLGRKSHRARHERGLDLRRCRCPSSSLTSAAAAAARTTAAEMLLSRWQVFSSFSPQFLTSVNLSNIALHPTAPRPRRSDERAAAPKGADAERDVVRPACSWLQALRPTNACSVVAGAHSDGERAAPRTRPPLLREDALRLEASPPRAPQRSCMANRGWECVFCVFRNERKRRKEKLNFSFSLALEGKERTKFVKQRERERELAIFFSTFFFLAFFLPHGFRDDDACSRAFSSGRRELSSSSQ